MTTSFKSTSGGDGILEVDDLISGGISINALRTDVAQQAINVKTAPFNATGDGVSDDTASIQSAFDAANTNGGGRVIFPPGTYIISSKLSFYSNMYIQGFDATIKLKSGNYSALVTMLTTTGFVNGAYNAATPIVENVTIDSLIIDGNKDNITTTNSCTGINAYKVDNFKVVNCIVKDLPGIIGNGYGIISWYSNRVIIEDTIVDKTDRQNITIWETLDAHINNCNLNFSYFRDNILVSGNVPVSLQSSYCTITNTKCLNDSATGTHVIRFAGFASGVIQNCEIEGNTSREGIYCVCEDNIFIRVENNEIKNCLYGFLAENDATGQTFIVSNNKILDCVNGIRLSLIADSAYITNNKVVGTTIASFYCNFVKNVIVEGNEFDGGTDNLSCFTMNSFHFINNVVRNLTFASYAVLFNSTVSGIPIVTVNTCELNTNNDIRILTDARAIGNRTTINSTTTRFELLNKYAMFYANAAPTTLLTGSTVGDTVINIAPTRVRNIDRWRLISASGNGTWQAFGTGWGTTAERPTLTLQDAGYSFMDTTIAKMILWDGTVWLV